MSTCTPGNGVPCPLVTVIATPVRDTGAGAGARRGAVAGAAGPGAGAGCVWAGRGAAGAGVCPNDVLPIKSDKLNQNSVRIFHSMPRPVRVTTGCGDTRPRQRARRALRRFRRRAPPSRASDREAAHLSVSRMASQSWPVTSAPVFPLSRGNWSARSPQAYSHRKSVLAPDERDGASNSSDPLAKATRQGLS